VGNYRQPQRNALSFARSRERRSGRIQPVWLSYRIECRAKRPKYSSQEIAEAYILSLKFIAENVVILSEAQNLCSLRADDLVNLPTETIG
jgi:hypothetical protein